MEFTVRNAAKYAVRAAVHGKVAQLTEDTIVDNTNFEEDDTLVNIGSYLVGWYVSDKLKPYTDKMVDKTADFIPAKRADRIAKKPTEEKK